MNIYKFIKSLNNDNKSYLSLLPKEIIKLILVNMNKIYVIFTLNIIQPNMLCYQLFDLDEWNLFLHCFNEISYIYIPCHYIISSILYKDFEDYYEYYDDIKIISKYLDIFGEKWNNYINIFYSIEKNWVFQYTKNKIIFENNKRYLLSRQLIVYNPIHQ